MGLNGNFFKTQKLIFLRFFSEFWLKNALKISEDPAFSARYCLFLSMVRPAIENFLNLLSLDLKKCFIWSMIYIGNLIPRIMIFKEFNNSLYFIKILAYIFINRILYHGTKTVQNKGKKFKKKFFSDGNPGTKPRSRDLKKKNSDTKSGVFR